MSDESDSPKQVGSCCEPMRDALSMQAPIVSHFTVLQENQTLYVAVGSVATDEGTSWFDQAVRFCPFCGAQVQPAE